MNRYFHLYPSQEDQQRLRASLSLKDIHYQAGFQSILEEFGITAEEVDDEISQASRSHQEFIIRPPLPPEQIKKFGKTLVNFAGASGRAGSEDIGFIDHTGEQDEIVWYLDK